MGSDFETRDSHEAIDETTLQADAETAREGQARPKLHELKRGSTVDRYVALELLGSGGMGVVYAAYDPNLDRRVALKLLLQSDGDGPGNSAGHARTLREAQAMARLSHPNVVTVHDVGTADGVVYIAMELVDGQTLSQWLADGSRTWRDVLDVFEAAGAGLEAAHAVGLVHRDFKLDNVMLGRDGRIRVMDFGLARSASEDTTRADTGDWSSDLGDVDRLTRTGALVGTPAYMAPELLKGEGGDARADQFAFCVALFRCLYGTRPFGGSSLAELYESTTHGRVVNTPIAKVPRWLSAVVRRGLASDPEQRYPSLTALLRALAQGRRRRGRLVAAGGVGLVAVAASSASFIASARECSGGKARFATVWNADVEERVRLAFVGSGAGQADDAAARVTEALDEHADRWTEQYQAACNANRRGEQSDELLDRRMACLGRNLAEVEAVLGALTLADRGTVARAVVAVTRLAGVDACADVERVLADGQTPNDPEVAELVEALRSSMARAGGLAKAGRYDDSYEIAMEVLPQAEASGFRPLIAEVERALGSLHGDLGRPQEALDHLERACFEAEASEHGLVAAKAWTMRVQLEGVILGKPERGAAAAERAEAAVIRMDDRTDLRSDVELAKAALALETGRYDEALEGYREAHALAERAEGADSLLAARAMNSIGAAQYKLGRFRQAIDSYQAAREIMVEVLGERHPETADVLQNIGAMELMLGNVEDGRERLQEALGILEDTLGSQHMKVAEVLFNLGWASQKLHEPEVALEYFDRARVLELPRLGDKHPLVGQYEASIAVVLIDMERWAAAKEHLATARDVFVAAYGPRHNDVARVLQDLGKCARKLADNATAETHYREALDIRREALPPEHPELADSLHGLTLSLVAQQRFSDARPVVDELVAIRSKREADDPQDLFDALLLAGDVQRGLDDRSTARQRYQRAATIAEGQDPDAHREALDRVAALDDSP